MIKAVGKKILLTGMPRSGKSTLLKKIIENIPNKAGFITDEIKKNGEIKSSNVKINTPEGTSCTDTGKGTKHRTACEISEFTNCIAIAVSDDGPISIYIKGRIKYRYL